MRHILMIQSGKPDSDGNHAGDPRGLTVLLAEDEAAIRNLIRPLLQRQGFTVLEAADGVAALEEAERYAGPIHLLLTDWCMPRLGGEGLIARLTSQRPGMAILVMSGTVDGEAPCGALVLRKPFRMQELVGAIDRLLSFKAPDRMR